jgi:transposase
MVKIALDAHKRYSFISVEDRPGQVIFEDKVNHQKGAIKGSLGAFASGSSVAVEAMGNWYWIVDEIEAAGMRPKLVHPRKAKLLLGCINKTDKLDARGLNRLQWVGTLPTVWIPEGDCRDKRSLTRTRMYLVHQRTSLKCRVHAILAAYAIIIDEVSDLFGKRGREILERRRRELPELTAFTTELQLSQIDLYDENIVELERRMAEVFEPTEMVKLLDSLPGIGFNLAVTVGLEVGDIQRFPSAEKFASYAGTTPRVHASGGKVRYGRTRPDVNRYLKWAYIEAASSICLNQDHWPWRHVVKLYKRVKASKGSSKAKMAVARHLAEATYWILQKKEPYRDPALKKGDEDSPVG